MKFLTLIFTAALLVAALAGNAQKEITDTANTISRDAELSQKAKDWVAALKLDNHANEDRVREVVLTHLKTIRDWNDTHPFTTVPAGINPVTGKNLSELDRQIIANSAMPASVHQNLMSGLRKELNEEQVEFILDKYTIGKVAFTMKAYREIVPGITATEDSTILGYMKQAREQAVDYKSIKQVSAIFEIYKTKAEQYLNANGRSWREMYRNYTNMLKEKKAAATNK